MRYYYTPPMNVPLSAGFDTFRNLDVTEDEHLEALLRTLQGLERRTGEAVEADFVTWRGMCTKVSRLLVEREESIVVWKGQWLERYLCFVM
jgi:RAT1-interacting protein